MPYFTRIICLIAVSLSLSACTKEPSQEELQTLYTTKVNSTNALAEKIMNQQGSVIQVKQFEKIDCTKIENSKDYLCRVNVTVNLPFLGDQKNTPELRVTKGDNGWIMLD